MPVTAIGIKFASPYACTYMDKTETDVLKTQELQPFVWLRYIDDIFFIWAHGEAELKKLMKGLNNFLPNFQFTYDSSRKRVAFLDLNVSLKNVSITTDLYTKSTDCHQYLHCSTSHPDHIKNSIIYSQSLRLGNICTYEEDFDNHACSCIFNNHNHQSFIRIWNHAFWRGDTQNRSLIHKWEKLNLVKD